MMKLVMGAVFAFLFSTPAFASAALPAGRWCQQYDDFTRVLEISSAGEIKSYSVGVDAGEVIMREKGYLSIGASGVAMVIGGHDQGLLDFKVLQAALGLGRARLVLSYQISEYQNKAREVYLDCR